MTLSMIKFQHSLQTYGPNLAVYNQRLTDTDSIKNWMWYVLNVFCHALH